MYLTHNIDDLGQVIFVLVLPYEQRAVAGKHGFFWNHQQKGAWATSIIDSPVNLIKSGEQVSIAPATLDYIWQNSAMTDATYSKLKAAHVEPTRKEQAGIYAATMSEEQVGWVHHGLKVLAGVCDGAMSQDGQGFNRNDIDFGHSMAHAAKLTRNQAGFGKALLKKYRKQLGEELHQQIFPEDYASLQTEKQKLVADRADALAKQAADRVQVTPSGERVIVQLEKIEVAPDGNTIIVPYQPSEPIGYTDPTGTLVVTKPEQIVVADTGTGDDAEIARLAKSLIDCHPADFDTTVDLLRALRKVDAPKEAGSNFAKAAWTAAGYQAK